MSRNIRKYFFPPREWKPIACSLVVTVVLLSCNPLSRGEPSQRTGESTSVGALSANRFYREFNDNPINATDKYQGKTVALEGLVGKIFQLEHGDAALHISYEANSRAIIANFPRQHDLRGSNVGDKIQFQCEFDKFEFKTIWMNFCTPAPREAIGREPVIVSSNVPSANLLYREYEANEKAASAKHDGTIVKIEARLGNKIQSDDGGVTVHIAEGNRNALIAIFTDASAVAGIEQGELFRLRCRVRKFDYQKLWLEACQIEH